MKAAIKASPRLVLFISTISAFCTSFAASSVNIALPLIGSEFHLSGVALNWVVTSFVLTSAVLVMPMGRFGDLQGRQRVFGLGMLLYFAGSAAAALAPQAAWLIAARALTALGAAMALGTVTAILVAAYPASQRGRILGINVSMVYAGISLGPVLGGLMTQALGWRALFWLHAALALVVVALVMFRLKGDDRETHHASFDFAGSVLYASGLALLLLGLSNLPQLLGIGLLTAGTVLLTGFWILEAKIASPILPVALFTKNRIFAFSNLAAMISYSATFAITFFLSLYLEVIRGLSPAQAGMLLLAQPLIQAVFSPLTGHLSDRISPRLLASLGMALTTLGLLGLAFIDASTSLVWITAALVLLGLGFAFFSSPNTNSIMSAVDQRDLGLASATVATVRSVGMMLSMGMALVLLSLILGKAEVSPATTEPFLFAMRWGFWISSGLCALGVGASLARGPRRAKP